MLLKEAKHGLFLIGFLTEKITKAFSIILPEVYTVKSLVWRSLLGSQNKCMYD